MRILNITLHDFGVDTNNPFSCQPTVTVWEDTSPPSYLYTGSASPNSVVFNANGAFFDQSALHDQYVELIKAELAAPGIGIPANSYDDVYISGVPQRAA